MKPDLKQEKWDKRFLELAELVAGWSKDPSTKCGAVLVHPYTKQVLGTGYNGFPRGCDDAQHLYDLRETKYSRVVHAEVNAILFAGREAEGATLYTWPPGAGPTCDRCAAVVIQAGVRRVVYRHSEDGEWTGRWAAANGRALAMYREAGVAVVRA